MTPNVRGLYGSGSVRVWGVNSASAGFGLQYNTRFSSPRDCDAQEFEFELGSLSLRPADMNRFVILMRLR
jgi:hypothetical protein